jgi:hypothetical protein
VEAISLLGATLCYKEKAVEKETYVISSTTLNLYLRVPGLNINQDTSYSDLGFAWFPQDPPVKCQDRTHKKDMTTSYQTHTNPSSFLIILPAFLNSV